MTHLDIKKIIHKLTLPRKKMLNNIHVVLHDKNVEWLASIKLSVENQYNQTRKTRLFLTGAHAVSG
jgi:hypothetical protein